MKLTTIIIPHKDNDGSDNAVTISATVSEMVDQFGGATSWDAQGHWKNLEGRLYVDDVKIIQSATAAPADATMEILASLVLETTDQEAVFYTVDGIATIKTRT